MRNPKPRQPALQAEFKLKWRVGGDVAARIVKIAARFESAIEVESAGTRVNAKDVRYWLLIAPYEKGTAGETGLKAGQRIKLYIRGADAPAAMAALKGFFAK